MFCVKLFFCDISASQDVYFCFSRFFKQYFNVFFSGFFFNQIWCLFFWPLSNVCSCPSRPPYDTDKQNSCSRLLLNIWKDKRSRDTKYNSQNKSPVYCQTTNFTHTSKQAVIKQKVADKNKRKGKRKEALFFGLTLPYKQTSYGTAKVHTLNLLECSEFNGLRGFCLF